MTPFKKKPTKRSFVCNLCHHSIDKANEPNGEIKKIDGKPVCVICRATKLSPLSSLIKKGKTKHETEKKFLEEKSQKEALTEVEEIALASQERAGNRFRLSPKKFLQ